MELPQNFFNHDAQAGGFYPKAHVGIDVKSFGQKNNLIIEGIRGTGKTHILKMVERHCLDNFEKERVLPIYISLAQINEHVRKEPDEFRLHLYTHIVQRCVETIGTHKSRLNPDKPILAKAIEALTRLFKVNDTPTFDELVKKIQDTAENLRFELQFNLTSNNFKEAATETYSTTDSSVGKIALKVKATEVSYGSESRESNSLTGNVENNLMYVGSKLAHKNASTFLIEFLKQLQVILDLEHSLLLLDECSEADFRAQVEIFGLFKAIRGSTTLLHNKSSCVHFIGSVYPQGATYYPRRDVDGFSFEPGQDCSVEFMEWDELDQKTYLGFYKDMLLNRAREILGFKGDCGQLITDVFENYNTFLLSAFASNGIPRRFWEILKRGYDRSSEKILSKGIEIAIQEIANDQILNMNGITTEDIEFINDLVDRLINKNVEIRRNNKKNNTTWPQYLYFSVDRQHRHALDRLVVQGAVHDKSRMRMKSKLALKPIYSIDIAVAYNFSIIPHSSFVDSMLNEIPRCANNGFDQAFDVKSSILTSAYKSFVGSDKLETRVTFQVSDTGETTRIEEGVIYSYVPGNFGYIEVIDGGPNAFFYSNQVKHKYRLTIKKGDKVAFSLKTSARGRQAHNIKIIS